MNKTFRKAFHSTLHCHRGSPPTQQPTAEQRVKRSPSQIDLQQGVEEKFEHHQKEQTPLEQLTKETTSKGNEISAANHRCCICNSSASDASDTWYVDDGSAKASSSCETWGIVCPKGPDPGQHIEPCISIAIATPEPVQGESVNEQEQHHGIGVGVGVEQLVRGDQLPGSHAYVYPTSPAYGIHQLHELLSYMERTFHEKLATLPSTAV